MRFIFSVAMTERAGRRERPRVSTTSQAGRLLVVLAALVAASLVVGPATGSSQSPTDPVYDNRVGPAGSCFTGGLSTNSCSLTLRFVFDPGSRTIYELTGSSSAPWSCQGTDPDGAQASLDGNGVFFEVPSTIPVS